MPSAAISTTTCPRGHAGSGASSRSRRSRGACSLKVRKGFLGSKSQRFSGLDQDQATVDGEDVSGHVVRAVPREEHGGTGEILWHGDTFEENA